MHASLHLRFSLPHTTSEAINPVSVALAFLPQHNTYIRSSVGRLITCNDCHATTIINNLSLHYFLYQLTPQLRGLLQILQLHDLSVFQSQPLVGTIGTWTIEGGFHRFNDKTISSVADSVDVLDSLFKSDGVARDRLLRLLTTCHPCWR